MGITAITTKPVRLAVASLAGLGIAGGIAVAANAASGTVHTSARQPDGALRPRHRLLRP